MDVVILSNRKDKYLPDCLESLLEHVNPIDDIIVIDDSGDLQWREGLGFTVIPVDDKPAGYTRAMAKVVETLSQLDGPAFFVEEDFIFNDEVDLDVMLAEMEASPCRLAQVALERDPWYANEKACGSVSQAQLERVKVERGWGNLEVDGALLVHDLGFTCNPSIWNPEVLELGWPQVQWSETAFGDLCLKNGFIFSYWNETGLTTHNGAVRAESSHGY